MLTAILLGLAGGIILSIPPGPLSVAVIKQGLQGNVRRGLMIAVGAAIMDVVFTLLAAFASSAIVIALADIFHSSEWFPFGFQIGCIAVLLVLAVRYIRQRNKVISDRRYAEREAREEARAQKLGHQAPLFIGVLIAITNLASPTFLPSLVGFIGYLQANGWLDGGVQDNVTYAIAFGIGTTAWFLFLLKMMISFREMLSQRFLANIYQFAGGTFILFALVILINVLTTTEWSFLF